MIRYHYTQRDFADKAAAQASLLRLLEPLKPFYSQGGARVELGVTSAHYENDSIPMEAFARPLWGLVPFWAGGGSERAFEELYRRGFENGPDRSHPEYWHTCRDYDQKFCEMAAVSYGILFTPEKIWAPLSERGKNNLVEWLWEINRHECCACNWQWFATLTNLALKSVGRPYSRERVASGLQMMEDYYDGGGWYGDGASIAYGRSMTYRFAQGAFFAVALLTGEEVLPLPVMKGILTRHLTWWLNQPIYDNAGVLTIGYAYPNLQMSESYNAPGSPYWALKSFAFLALPDNHPFWAAECAPLPPLEPCKYLPHANMIVQRDDNNAVALVPGRTELDDHSHTVEKYSKFAYSSRFGFSISRSAYTLAQTAPDSMLCFQVGRLYYVRDTVEPEYHIGPDGIETRWLPVDGVQVTTRIEPTPTGHIRTHTIQSDFDCRAYDCGFAVNADDRISPVRRAQGGQAEVRCGEDFCAVVCLEGAGRGEMLLPDPNTNLIFPKTAIPMAVYAIRRGTQTIRTRVDYFP